MAGQIKVVLFDLGRVLVDFDHKRAAERISFFCTKSPQEIYNLFFESEATIAFEAGKISPENFYLRVKEMLDLKLSYESFIPIWNDIFYLSPKNRSIFKLVNSLRARYKTALLSNINALHYEYVKKNFPVFGVFDEIFLSFELGLIKPDKEIYNSVVRKLKVNPQEIFYTDDRADLVESAKALGLRGSVFTNLEQLVNDIQAAGIVFIDDKNKNSNPYF
ncbi:MAG: HAD family phosphatase [Candidatus Omnitrophica bacterium]|nr:HAD family phosphatase [Candidatus Omnitrophota bacterium]